MKSFIADYDLVVARDIALVLELLSRDEGWRPIAGGTDLMVLLNAGKLHYKKLVSIRDVPSLRTITSNDMYVEIGAAATYAQIRHHPLLQAEFPLLCRAAGWTGSVANQNRGTLGGNIANASPAGDSLPVLLVYDAELKLISRRGERKLPYSDFHTGYKQMQLSPDELIGAVVLRRPSGRVQAYSRKVGTRRAQAISKICIAGLAEKNGDLLTSIRIAFASVAPIPLRCTATESVLRGKRVSTALINEARQALNREIMPITDIRSTAEYRSSVAGNLLEAFLSDLQ